MAQHWYTSQGDPCHTVVGKNGKERDTTLADARKLNLFPSATGIIGLLDKPNLQKYYFNNLLDAVVKNPFHPEEALEDEWRKEMLIKMKAHSKRARDRGTEIHGKLDDFFKGKSVKMDKDWKFIEPTLLLIEKTFGLEGWVSEKSFASTRCGFAGCVDLHHPEKHIILDFKTKDKEELKGVKQYDEHKMQLAAYQIGLEMPSNARRFNIFISTNENTPGQCLLEECREFERYLGMFSNLHMYWMAKNKYDPRQLVDVYL